MNKPSEFERIQIHNISINKFIENIKVNNTSYETFYMGGNNRNYSMTANTFSELYPMSSDEIDYSINTLKDNLEAIENTALRGSDIPLYLKRFIRLMERNKDIFKKAGSTPLEQVNAPFKLTANDVLEVTKLLNMLRKRTYRILTYRNMQVEHLKNVDKEIKDRYRGAEEVVYSYYFRDEIDKMFAKQNPDDFQVKQGIKLSSNWEISFPGNEYWKVDGNDLIMPYYSTYMGAKYTRSAGSIEHYVNYRFKNGYKKVQEINQKSFNEHEEWRLRKRAELSSEYYNDILNVSLYMLPPLNRICNVVETVLSNCIYGLVVAHTKARIDTDKRGDRQFLIYNREQEEWLPCEEYHCNMDMRLREASENFSRMYMKLIQEQDIPKEVQEIYDSYKEPVKQVA